MLATWTPQYWQFWIGLVLVVIVLVGRDRMTGWLNSVRTLLARVAPRATGRVGAVGASAVDGD